MSMRNTGDKIEQRRIKFSLAASLFLTALVGSITLSSVHLSAEEQQNSREGSAVFKAVFSPENGDGPLCWNYTGKQCETLSFPISRKKTNFFIFRSV